MTNAQSKYTLDKCTFDKGTTKRGQMGETPRTEHELAVWLEEQEDNYHPDISKSKGMLTNPELHKLFTEFVNDPKYSKYITKMRCSGCGRHDDFCRCGDFMGFGED
tara:strand:- start:208 stop:525 length:318 start_codon:yes stop_codon:yes gene_type:complete